MKERKKERKTLQNARAFFIWLFLLPKTETVANPCSIWTKGNPPTGDSSFIFKDEKKEEEEKGT